MKFIRQEINIILNHSHFQGEMLNHIESNVESALDYANKAHGKVKEVRKIREGLRKVNFQ